MRIDILSLFPDYFKGPFDESIIGRACKSGKVEIVLHDIRDYAEGKHRKVDDRPYGGGPGMLLMAPPLVKAIRNLHSPKCRRIYLSPQGKMLTPELALELSQYEHLLFVCGHYEGIDQRVIDSEIDEEVSIGPYVLSNGCAAAIVVVDALLRFVPGVLGNAESFKEDSFQEGVLDWPHYTRPPEFEGKRVPDVLLEGHHKKIDAWRQKEALEKTILMQAASLDVETHGAKNELNDSSVGDEKNE